MTAYEIRQMDEWCQDELEAFIFVEVQRCEMLIDADKIQDIDLNCN